MSHLHATFRTLASQNLPLGRLVGNANRLFCDSTTAGQYVTLVVDAPGTTAKWNTPAPDTCPLLHASRTGVTSRQARVFLWECSAPQTSCLQLSNWIPAIHYFSIQMVFRRSSTSKATSTVFAV